MRTIFHFSIIEHLKVVEELLLDITNLTHVSTVILNTFQNGGKLLLCGNGGSAADCQHLAAEFMVRFSSNRKPLPAIALTTDSSLFTAHTNDLDPSTLFSRQISALAKPEDCIIAISTSGHSPNILKAIEQANELSIPIIVLTGISGEYLRNDVTAMIAVPTYETARIQEAHILIGHMICEFIEENMDVV